MKNTRTHRTLNKIRTALIGTALVAAANYVSPVDAAMISGAIGDDGSGPPGSFDDSIVATANTTESGGNRLPVYAINGAGIVLGGGAATDRTNYEHDADDENGDLIKDTGEIGGVAIVDDEDFRVIITPADTATLKPGSYWALVRVTKSNGEVLRLPKHEVEVAV